MTSTLVVMQPHYLPWAGYFNLIARASVFVFLDDVQFARSTWQARNRVLAGGKEHLLTVPTKRMSLSQQIKDVAIQDDGNWRHKHFALLIQNYAKRPYGAEVLELLSIINDTAITRLAELDVRIIKAFSEKLGLLETRFHFSSELGIDGDRSGRLIRMAEKFDCDTYLSPRGARDYLEADGLFRDGPIRLELQDFAPKPYDQGSKAPFVSHLSIVDVVANIGWTGARAYIQ